jgi:Coenzyme F420-dependent N5,N10-methylene tetrahydromethanopterin reductase and related flavin-dependent oxidoreductases
MTSEFIGHTSNREGSDVVPATGPVIDKAYIRNHVQAAEAAGIDRLLIGQFAQWPDNNQIAAYVFSQTERIGALLAHRPGLMAPTLGARQLATLDQFSEGRVWVHIITGGSDTDQARDGDFEDHDTRYARTDEYIEVLKKVWESEQPFDHEGRFYRFKGAFSQVKPFQKPRIPISFGGSSDAAIAVAGKHADIYALWGGGSRWTAPRKPSPRSAPRLWPMADRRATSGSPSPSARWWRKPRTRPGRRRRKFSTR